MLVAQQRRDGFAQHAHAALALPAQAAAQLGELLQRASRGGKDKKAGDSRKAKPPRTLFASMSASADAQSRPVNRRRNGGASLCGIHAAGALARCFARCARSEPD
jgi:hypothetical protein